MDLAPPDLYNRNSQTGKSAVDIFREESGHYLTKASNDRVNGWLAVKEWLAMTTDNQGNKHPKLRIFANCTNLIRCLPLLVHDEKNPNDCKTEPHEITHAPDALRYFCSSWTFAPIITPQRQNEDWLNRALKEHYANENKGEYIEW